MATIPTIEMVGPAGRRVVNAIEEQDWRARGYKRIGEKSTSLDNMKLAELKELAAQKNIDVSKLRKKADIIKALEKAEAGASDAEE